MKSTCSASSSGYSHSKLKELCRLLAIDMPEELADALLTEDSEVFLRIEAGVCSRNGTPVKNRLLLAHIKLDELDDIHGDIPNASGQSVEPIEARAQSENCPLTPEPEGFDNSIAKNGHKRRKLVGGLRLCSSASRDEVDGHNNVEGVIGERDITTCRQLLGGSRFPQRKPPQNTSAPVLEPTSGDRLILGIWRQIFSNIRLTTSRLATTQDPAINIRGAIDRKAFNVINTICLNYHNLSHSSRALEMVVQAYWVECYEARIATLKIEKPLKSMGDINMEALKEACDTFNWSEKELRNKLAIWRGYRDIKNAGGWVSLIFASSGVYRFCKYRTGFNQAFGTRLSQLRSSFELAADTLHPEWRQLLNIISQDSSLVYTGHPHQWATRNGEDALPLYLTYPHIPNFGYEFIKESVLDRDAFGTEDPRRTPGIKPDRCHDCGQYQSNNVERNRCSCFPTLYGNPTSHPPIQIFQTSNGKNNGVVSRCGFERGAAIGEFIGYITRGIAGVDVMAAGSPAQPYQIFQGEIGNFTRFINHSCRPNCQFQKFYWLGMERVIVVSRGVSVGAELTVDYSDRYWEQLDKECLCGEESCRYPTSQNGRR
ncbi:hypothetical protein FQN49_003476 [Arthroderma sp. PD_2]|nr:hypothetical protein FQN49_003476 [Arthroderma sp. PD_2]